MSKAVTTNKTELAIIEQLNETGMQEKAARQLLDSYGVPWTRAGELIEQARELTVESEEDLATMKLARDIRLELRGERITIEKQHDILKADSLAYGRAVDLVQRIALEQIKPIEAHLQLQEKYAETKQEERRQKRIAERTQALAQYTNDPSMYNYADMADDAFAMLLGQVRIAHEAELAQAKALEEEAARLAAEAEAARKAQEEADRIAREKAEAEAQKLRDELAAKEAEAAKERAAMQQEAIKAAAEHAKALEAERKAREEAEAKIAAEKARVAAEEAEKARIAKEQQEATTRAQNAPDKQKLLDWVDTMAEADGPGLMKTDKAERIAERIMDHLAASYDTYRKLIEKEL